jgi:hypothetical protein
VEVVAEEAVVVEEAAVEAAVAHQHWPQLPHHSNRSR